MLIATGKLDRESLAGRVAIVTGAGGGIGFEASRSLLWLGARVVVAEIDVEAGREAEARLAAEWSAARVAFVPTDVGDEASVRHLCDSTMTLFGRIDVVVNNATFAPVGAPVAEAGVDAWDKSYAVNLRGPVLLARGVLPAMIARKSGVFVCVSSTGGPYLAPYETLKAAQVALANSLDAELAGTGVIAFTIGPGLVPTQTATRAVEVLAPKLGMTVERFWTVNEGAVLSVEAAGAGFAAAVALAERYAGQEISSSQALIDAGVEIPSEAANGAPVAVRDAAAAAGLCARVRKTLAEQNDGWKQRSFFERQWMLRDFKQHAGMPVERCLESLSQMESGLAAGRGTIDEQDLAFLERLSGFYRHLGGLAQGYVKDPRQRDEQLRTVGGWKSEVDSLVGLLREAAAMGPEHHGPIGPRETAGVPDTLSAC
ncbi:MAG TPA: SDR family NAD(P)-dependent oxidoreductase [Candidatus Dormibacteraeota bacterium]|nr:SDR family NAD(P)-dependent oxidoreductase [Candidatus Dormibacteraeota bacterium]